MSERPNQTVSFYIDLKVMGQNISLNILETDTKQSVIQKLSLMQSIEQNQSKLIMDKLIQHLKKSLETQNEMHSPRLQACIAAFLCRTTTNKIQKQQQQSILKDKAKVRIEQTNSQNKCKKKNKKPTVRQILGNKKIVNNKPIITQMSEDLRKAYEAVYRKSRNTTFKCMAQQFLSSKAQTILCQISVPSYMKQSKSSAVGTNNKKIRQIINNYQQTQQKQSRNKQQNTIIQQQNLQKSFQKNSHKKSKIFDKKQTRKSTEQEIQNQVSTEIDRTPLATSQLLASYMKPYQYLPNQQFNNKYANINKQSDSFSDLRRKKYQYMIN